MGRAQPSGAFWVESLLSPPEASVLAPPDATTLHRVGWDAGVWWRGPRGSQGGAALGGGGGGPGVCSSTSSPGWDGTAAGPRWPCGGDGEGGGGWARWAGGGGDCSRWDRADGEPAGPGQSPAGVYRPGYGPGVTGSPLSAASFHGPLLSCQGVGSGVWGLGFLLVKVVVERGSGRCAAHAVPLPFQADASPRELSRAC